MDLDSKLSTLEINTETRKQENCQVHVLEEQSDVWQVIRNITNSGNQEDPFYVLNIGDIVKQHEEWLAYLPRIKPYYGK